MFRKILGPSPLLCGVRKLHSHLFFRSGSQEYDNTCLSDEAFFEMINEANDKPPRLNSREVRELLANKAKLTKEQELLKSVLKEARLSRALSEKDFESVQEMYEFRRKYKNYLRLKRFIPLAFVFPFKTSKLSKMTYAAALVSKSVSLTLPGLIGYSLRAFYFFHMSSFYVPDKIKPVCQVCKYTVGAPFWIVSSITNEVTSTSKEIYFGEEVPLDVVGTGGTIPGDLGDFNRLREILDEMKEFGKKTY